jgi:hypothetical protein
MTKGPVFCTICLATRKRNEEWFLLVENRWTDRLKILSWNDELASSPATHAACCATHVQLLVVHWMTTGTLHYPFAHSEAWAETSESPRARGLSSMRDEPDMTGGRVLEELAVDRETIDRILVDNPASLAVMLTALKDALPEQADRSEVAELQACGEYALSEA